MYVGTKINNHTIVFTKLYLVNRILCDEFSVRVLLAGFFLSTFF